MRNITNARGLFAYAHDIVMTAASFVISAYLRLGYDPWEIRDEWLVLGLLIITIISAAVYLQMGLYRGIWRYASVRDLTAIAKAASLILLLFLFVMFIWTRLESLPRSLPFINWLVLIALLGGPRLAYRIIRDRGLDFKDTPSGKRRIPVLLAGAGDGAELFIRALSHQGAAEYKVVGILSESAQRVGQQIHGVRVLSTIEQFDRIISGLAQSADRPQRLILTKDNFEGSIVRRLLDQCTAHAITLVRMPRLTDFRSGDPEDISTRPIDVEDLLGRAQTLLDKGAMRDFISGKRHLVTGAGGSIGSELVHQIAALDPREIILLDSSEYGLYQITEDILDAFPEIMCQSIIADVRDKARISQVFETYKPEVVFHAAALKHVPLVEENCREGVATNIFGTANIADNCINHSVSTMVQISTDKAINPTNIMGATKRIAEQYCQALDIARGSKKGTNFVTVRFGNVLGSTGSVIPLFQKQLENGGPLTVTHPDMTRYFMTIREAVELVLLASAKAKSDASQAGKIFVLDMGEPIRIIDLAEQMIRLNGLIPGKDIKIDIIGNRPGEKLFEELLHDAERIIDVEIEGLFLAEPRVSDIDKLRRNLDDLKSACELEDEDNIKMQLSKLVPEGSYTTTPDSGDQPNG